MAAHKQSDDSIPDDLKEQAKGMIRQAFDFFSGHFKQLATDLKEVNKKYDEAQKRIDRGVRRTDGRII